MRTLRELMATLPQTGRIEWIGTRPARNEPMCEHEHIIVERGAGLPGDRYGKKDGKRQVSFIQAEHLVVMGAMLGEEAIAPHRLRRNIVVSGLNLLALKDKEFTIGQARFEYSEPCHPCSRMEDELGPGGYNIMRGHGGILARVIEAGEIYVGAPVVAAPNLIEIDT